MGHAFGGVFLTLSTSPWVVFPRHREFSLQFTAVQVAR